MLYNPDLVSRYFMVPGVLAMIIMIMTMMLTSMALVRETEVGTMEQLLVTPLTPGAIIVGKLVPYALVGTIEILHRPAGGAVLVPGAAARLAADCSPC